MKFDDWLFHLLLASEIGDNPDAHIRRAAVERKAWHKRRRNTDVVTMRVLNRLIKSPAPSALLRGTLTEAHFTND
jgi:hypothetical protein